MARNVGLWGLKRFEADVFSRFRWGIAVHSEVNILVYTIIPVNLALAPAPSDLVLAKVFTVGARVFYYE